MSTYTPELISSPAAGFGLTTIDRDGQVLDVWYPQPNLTTEPEHILGLSAATGRDPIRETQTDTVATVIADLSQPAVDTADVYLRLHLLSHR
ncbi:MAG: hypothetical protein HQ526_07720, partial [Actinobacteria bacterium]|nr:hypothetical protein [Actinomycetota bacterium]